MEGGEHSPTKANSVSNSRKNVNKAPQGTYVMSQTLLATKQPNQ